MKRLAKVLGCVAVSLLAVGCPKGKPDYNQGMKAESLQDYDAAYDYYQKALKGDPGNTVYQIKFDQARFEASTFHVKQGVKLRERGDLQGAAAEFQRAEAIDPSSPIAEQELRRTAEMIAEQDRVANAASQHAVEEAGSGLASAPPQLKPLSQAPITLTMRNDAKEVFKTIGKFAGVTVIFDPDFASKPIGFDVNNVTLEQALDIASLQAKAFWKPETENIIFVTTDSPQKRKDFEEMEVRTFYLRNTVQAQDLTEVVNGLRTLLDLRKIQAINSQNAVVVRDTPDKLALIAKMIDDIDKAKPEVIIEVSVLEASLSRMRQLGISPGTSASITVVPPGTTTTTSSSSSSTSSSTTTNILSLQNLTHLNGSDYSITLPSFTANALLSDSMTKLIQNPEIRSIEGQSAKLKFGDRVPIATGSFQAGVGVGGTTAGGVVSPLVNTQFTYQDVGVNIEVTPRVHPNREVSMKIGIEVSAVTGDQNIGGISQPIISQRKIDHEIRLREGESSILAGLINKMDTKSLSGWPGLASVPILHYFFSSDEHNVTDDEIMIVLTPHIVRMPDWTKANLTPLYSGSDSNIQVRKVSEVTAPTAQLVASANPAAAGAVGGKQANDANNAANPAVPKPPQNGQPAQLHFEPRTIAMKVGQEATVAIVVDNVTDLYSIPFLLQYNPATISVEEVKQGGFLQSGNQVIGIVSRIDKDRGQAIISATREPNTPGVNGTGTLMAIVIKALAPGNANLSIVQVNAKNSQQQGISLVTSEATVQVQP
jgi:general secretion pathway protein D